MIAEGARWCNAERPAGTGVEIAPPGCWLAGDRLMNLSPAPGSGQGALAGRFWGQKRANKAKKRPVLEALYRFFNGLAWSNPCRARTSTERGRRWWERLPAAISSKRGAQGQSRPEAAPTAGTPPGTGLAVWERALHANGRSLQPRPLARLRRVREQARSDTSGTATFHRLGVPATAQATWMSQILWCRQASVHSRAARIAAFSTPKWPV